MAEETSYRAVLSEVDFKDTKFCWGTALTIALFHVLALYALIFSFSGQGIFWAWFFSGFNVLGLSVGYHRLFTHHAFKTTPFIRRFLATIAVLGGYDSPAQWVAHHRVHHAFTDTPKDPHTPTKGFWYSHVLWPMLLPRTLKEYHLYERLSRDVTCDPYIAWLSKTRGPRWALQITLGICLYFAGGIHWVLWGVFVRIVIAWHAMFLVNSLTHIYGYRNYELPNSSTNVYLINLLNHGEGFHNNHHKTPSSAKFSHKWFEIDLQYGFIYLLEKVGLAWDVKKPDKLKLDAHQVVPKPL